MQVFRIGTYRDKSQGQKDHANHGQDADIVSLLDGPSTLLDGTSAEELIPQVFDLLAGTGVLLENFTKFLHNFVELTAQVGHMLTIGGSISSLWRRMRPQSCVGAGPEAVSKGLVVGVHHGPDAVINHGQGVVRPKVASNVSEVLVLKEELVTQLGVKHELGLSLVSRGSAEIEEGKLQEE